VFFAAVKQPFFHYTHFLDEKPPGRYRHQGLTAEKFPADGRSA